MNNFISFIKSEIHNEDFFINSFVAQKTNLDKLWLQEKENKESKIKDFYWILKDPYKKTIAIKLPENQKIQQYLKNRANICDYIVFIPEKNIVILTELKGYHINEATKQLKLGLSFFYYIVSIYNEEKKLNFSPKKVVRLIIKDSRNHALITNHKNKKAYFTVNTNEKFSFTLNAYDKCEIDISTFIEELKKYEKKLKY